ncbi:hypothetical protein [Planomonospora venezuelensis]|uniref:Uncharacterized protein n=1 Tax=Planomonospora venezuelensis TaxID=1999 RepID=A0A841DCX0_PLAVE|nr:hypothetical protein [Planomonospora venezuelensis]MBB5966138.1 hypothetical protein [Planomonospora venezuelensis]GIN04613.1 hypothetical protein Pve01_62710 [Planomonospora venezuelensis]
MTYRSPERFTARRAPRIVAAGFSAGSFVPRAMFEEARQVTVPLHVLLQWDDEGDDRQAALDLFGAFGSTERALHANMGGHTGVPQFAGRTRTGSSPGIRAGRRPSRRQAGKGSRSPPDKTRLIPPA